MHKIYINGKMVAEDKAVISIYDRSYLYGEGAFETLRAYSGRPAFCDMHYHRLKSNCEKLKIELPLDEYAFEHIILKTINANKLKDAFVRVTVSSVGASVGLARPKKTQTNFVVFAKKLKERAKEQYQHGARVVVIKSVTPDLPDVAEIKSTNYLTKILARNEVGLMSADEGLFKSRDGLVLEGTATNFFAVKDGVVYTPPITDGCLPGVTRFVLMGIVEELDIPCRESSIRLSDLKQMDEFFLTGSTSEVLPVAEIVGVIKRKAPGPVTSRLMKAYKEIVG